MNSLSVYTRSQRDELLADAAYEAAILLHDRVPLAAGQILGKPGPIYLAGVAIREAISQLYADYGFELQTDLLRRWYEIHVSGMDSMFNMSAVEFPQRFNIRTLYLLFLAEGLRNGYFD